MTPKTIIIGAGFAGLSAGVKLASSGHSVVILEQRPYCGGRAFSFQDSRTGIDIDNGQHILMGCYDHTLKFLKQIGAAHDLFIQKNLHVNFIDLSGHVHPLKCPPLPAPLHMALGIMAFKVLPLFKRFNMLRTAKDILWAERPSRDYPLSEWLDKHSQDNESRRVFWNILTCAIFNEDPANVSSVLFKDVARKAFFSSREGSRIIIPAVPLSRLYVDRAEEYIEKRGGMVIKRARVKELIIKEDFVEGIRLNNGSIVEGDYYICAIPFFALKRIIPEYMQKFNSSLIGIENLRTSPIISIHLIFDRPVMDLPFMAFIDSPIHWVFNRKQIYRREKRNIISIIMGNAYPYVKWNEAELINMVLSELKKYLRETGSAKLFSYRVIKERNATFVPYPGVESSRPPQKTPLKNLYLAGDWTATGLPATIESAVKSGHICAELVIRNPI